MHGHSLFERALPLQWTVLADDVPPITPDNHLLFKLLDFLDEPVSHNAKADNANELVRIDAKLNIILQLLGQLLQNRQALPTAVSLRFSDDSLAWRVGAQTPPVGTRLQVALYPDPSIPLAFTFIGKVCEVKDQWLEVGMHGLSEDELGIWSRWVFRQHRRQVAQARLAATDQKQSS